MSRLFTTKITQARLTLSPFSSEQMSNLGQIMVDTITNRIRFAKDVNDNIAKPLVKRYADRKIKRGRAPIRDLTWRGLTLGSFKVIRANQNTAVIGFVNNQADTIITAQNRLCPMYGVSPKDNEVLKRAALAMLKQHPVVKLEKSA